jgi:hypothetical protein
VPVYYYADAYIEPNGTSAPGKDTGSGLESGLDAIPPCCKALKVDIGHTPHRYVLQLHDSYNTPAPGWAEKTTGEIETDYPGLLGGG